MAGVIFLVSLVTLLMFFVSYCRSLTASTARHPLSAEVREVTGIRVDASGQDFRRVMQLLQLCPDRPEDRSSLQAVGTYYAFLGLMQKSLARLIPWLQTWTERERSGCATFAAVTLDRRIAFSREVLAQNGDL